MAARAEGRAGVGNLIGWLAVLAAVHLGVTAVEVLLAEGVDERFSVPAIVVMGAAQYDGEPSGALRVRLDHAADLHRQGIAPLVVVTGGRQEGDRFTEATVAADYLQDRGVDDNEILREVQGRTTYESLAAVSRFLRERDIDEVLVVSDPYHGRRIEAIAAEVGLAVSLSPTPDTVPRARWRETLGVGLGELLGHRRATAWFG